MQEIQTVRLDVSKDPDFLSAVEEFAVESICELGWAKLQESQIQEAVKDWFEKELSQIDSELFHLEIGLCGETVSLSAFDADGVRVAKRDL